MPHPLTSASNQYDQSWHQEMNPYALSFWDIARSGEPNSSNLYRLIQYECSYYMNLNRCIWIYKKNCPLKKEQQLSLFNNLSTMMDLSLRFLHDIYTEYHGIPKLLETFGNLSFVKDLPGNVSIDISTVLETHLVRSSALYASYLGNRDDQYWLYCLIKDSASRWLTSRNKISVEMDGYDDLMAYLREPAQLGIIYQEYIESLEDDEVKNKLLSYMSSFKAEEKEYFKVDDVIDEAYEIDRVLGELKLGVKDTMACIQHHFDSNLKVCQYFQHCSKLSDTSRIESKYIDSSYSCYMDKLKSQQQQFEEIFEGFKMNLQNPIDQFLAISNHFKVWIERYLKYSKKQFRYWDRLLESRDRLKALEPFLELSRMLVSCIPELYVQLITDFLRLITAGSKVYTYKQLLGLFEAHTKLNKQAILKSDSKLIQFSIGEMSTTMVLPSKHMWDRQASLKQ
ncbi:BA75_01621T0 [Komagataella pastoris]|uniref:BA75_01621T0 n=1 Tax=Komagataella pastoris TaxID=4922 RepID=A0A1B2J6S5_PICPA|nr:BA75_01621T0 [Komagataella pastoris]